MASMNYKIRVNVYKLREIMKRIQRKVYLKLTRNHNCPDIGLLQDVQAWNRFRLQSVLENDQTSKAKLAFQFFPERTHIFPYKGLSINDGIHFLVFLTPFLPFVTKCQTSQYLPSPLMSHVTLYYLTYTCSSKNKVQNHRSYLKFYF